ncbi:hypothetical protein V6R21_18440 [Limibacter armeniacum]|uniref:hypothetical protein n=1 Tax=Limibacter armeniacum TaxID=466084 RepID=UPI002FE66956
MFDHKYSIVRWRAHSSTLDSKPVHTLEMLDNNMSREDVYQLQQKMRHPNNATEQGLRSQYQHAFVVPMIALEEFDVRVEF